MATEGRQSRGLLGAIGNCCVQYISAGGMGIERIISCSQGSGNTGVPPLEIWLRTWLNDTV